jgi:hypothetical protein
MSSEGPRLTMPDPARGLPPVVPPTGGFIAQLFLVPGLIVATIVLLLLGAYWLFGGFRTPEQFLQNLDNENPEVRWRAADDLAQVLLRDEHLAADPKFALALVQRLRRAVDALAPTEKAYAEKMHKQPLGERDPERTALEAERSYVHYLLACLSNFTVPVGVPVLRELAEQSDVAAEADALAQRQDPWASRRPEAVWALAKLGENMKRFDQFSPERQQTALATLTEEAANHLEERSTWAQAALQLLQARQNGKPRLFGLDRTFAICATNDDPFLREMTALALNFWEGDAQENIGLDDILVQLAQDDGRTPGNTDPEKALEIRYNAAVALARRGSDRVRLDLLAELLDIERQLRNFHTDPKKGPVVADVDTAHTAVLSGLKAIAELHHKRPECDLSSLRSAIEKLAHGDAADLRGEAERTLQALGGK